MKYKSFFDDTLFIALISNFKANSWLRLNASLIQIHDQEDVDLKARPAKGDDFLRKSWDSFKLSNPELYQYTGQKAVITFIVNMDGGLSEIKLAESFDTETDKIIVKGVKKMGVKWLPAEKSKVLVRAGISLTLDL